MNHLYATPIFPWLETNGTLIALIAAVVAVVAPFVIARLTTSSLREEVADPTSWPYLIQRYNLTGAQGYYRTIRRLLFLADQLYGLRLLSLRAFNRSLQLAFIYPVLALMIGWLLFDAGTLGGIEFLPEDQPFVSRLWRIVLLFFAFAFSLNTFKLGTFIERRVSRFLTNRVENLTHRAGFLSELVRWVPDVAFAYAGAFIGAFVVVGAFAAALTVAFAGAFTSNFVVAFALAGAFAGVFTGAFVVAGALAATFAFAVVEISSDISEQFIVLKLFFVVLPWLNALFDFFSVAVTRRFLTHIRRHRPGFWLVLWDVLLDLGVAALCLFGLLGALWVVLETWQWLAPTSLIFDWQGYWYAVLHGDWQKSLVLILMATTTLIPTVLHLVMGLASFWAQESRAMARAIIALHSPPALSAESKPPVSWTNTVTRDIRRGIFLGWLKAVVAAGIVVFAIWWIWGWASTL